MALLINAIGYTCDFLSWAKKTFVEADSSVTSPSVVFSADEGTSVDPVCVAVEDVEMEERTPVVCPSTPTSSMVLVSADTEVLDDVEVLRGVDVEEDDERELSSLELSCVSESSLTVADVLRTVDVVAGEESELCLDSFSTGEVELCSDEQSSIPPAPVCESEPVVVTRSGRRSRRPDRYGYLMVPSVLQTVGVVGGKESKQCLDSSSIGEVDLCSDEQSSIPPSVVDKSRPVVYTRSGRRSCRPDHYGEWIYY